MDRTMASEAVGSGSIPLGTTNCKHLIIKGLHLKMGFFKRSKQASKYTKMPQNEGEKDYTFPGLFPQSGPFIVPP